MTSGHCREMVGRTLDFMHSIEDNTNTGSYAEAHAGQRIDDGTQQEGNDTRHSEGSESRTTTGHV